MKKLALYIPVFLLFFVQIGQTQTSYKLDPNSDSKVMIEGTSNVHDWECPVNQFSISADINEEALQDSTTDSFLSSYDFTAKVKSIECDKSKMNKKTYEILKSDEHPDITFAGNSVTMMAASDSMEVTGDLTIAGKTKTVTFPVAVEELAKDKYNFSGKYKIHTKDYGVERVKMFFGAIKTGGDVTIPFDVTMSAQ